MPHPIEIAICGGGIGGLSLAIGLLNQPQLSIRIYEAAPAFAEIGAGVSFGPIALRAMSLIDPKVREGYERRCTENAYPGKKEVWFDFRWGMDLKNGGKAGEWFHSTYARPSGQSSIHRVSGSFCFGSRGLLDETACADRRTYRRISWTSSWLWCRMSVLLSANVWRV